MAHINNWTELKKRVSWGSVFGGVVTVLEEIERCLEFI